MRCLLFRRRKEGEGCRDQRLGERGLRDQNTKRLRDRRSEIGFQRDRGRRWGGFVKDRKAEMLKLET
jgi:hypothetical protein